MHPIFHRGNGGGEHLQEILKNESVWKPFTDHGIIHPVGSYALGLLVYGDLDVYYEPTNPKNLIEIVANGLHTATHENAMKSKLTPQNRELILKVKHHVMGSMGKTPSFCSFNIYKAILEEGLEDLNEIKDYLRSQGIQLF